MGRIDLRATSSLASHLVWGASEPSFSNFFLHHTQPREGDIVWLSPGVRQPFILRGHDAELAPTGTSSPIGRNSEFQLVIPRARRNNTYIET